MIVNKKRKELIMEARTWLKTPFGPGAVKGISCSCVGLIVECLDTVKLFDSADKIRPFLGFTVPMSRLIMIEELNKFFPDRVKHGSQLPGDIALFYSGDGPKHVAFISESDSIIHSHFTYGKVVEHLRPKDWRMIMIYRLPGV